MVAGAPTASITASASATSSPAISAITPRRAMPQTVSASVTAATITSSPSHPAPSAQPAMPPSSTTAAVTIERVREVNTPALYRFSGGCGIESPG